MLKLRIEEAGAERTVPLDAGPVVLGRSETAGIVLTEPRASREHAELVPSGSTVLLRDLGSTNGTFVGDDRALQVRLGPGDRFRIGDTRFELLHEEPPPRRRRGRTATSVATIFGPAVVLLVVSLVALGAFAATRDEEVERARSRIELVEYRLAADEPDPEKSLAALRSFLSGNPRTDYGAEARGAIATLEPLVARIRRARAELAALEGAAGRMAYRELRWNYEKLLRSYSDLPGIAPRIHAALGELDHAHAETLLSLVADVRKEAESLAGKEDYGRAISLLTSFSERNPAAAARYEEDLRQVETKITSGAEAAYRDLLDRADGLDRAGKSPQAAAMLREQAHRFSGTRFATFLRLRADTIAARAGRTRAKKETEDLLSLRRTYSLLAQEAEELAAAGFFDRAADKYAGVLQSVRIPEIRDEFAVREGELRSLAALLESVRKQIAEKGRKFGVVRFPERAYRVVGMDGDTLLLEYRRQEVRKQWSTLFPEEMLALLDRAKLTPDEMLATALYCFDMNLRTDWLVRVLDLLERESLREPAGRLYARKEGLPYPDGGFHAYRGRILTGPERAEEMYREQVAKLRDRQGKLYQKLTAHPLFAKRLAKLAALRDELDKARAHALELIFDTVKFFYPYHDRMAEYVPVRDEVMARVDAVQAIWDNPLRVVVKEDPSLRSILEGLAEVNKEMHDLGVDTSGFDRAVSKLTVYLGRTLTIRNYFRDRVELSLFTYNEHVMKYNAELTCSALPIERRQVEVTNEYRMMMGRRALVIDDRLVRSAHGHSDEMVRLSYFSHFSPTKGRETPDKRAALEGYKGSAVSENIQRGSGTPEGAHRRWLGSSGHHRNLLQTFWTEMGTGMVSNHWTQNFGRTRPKEFPEED